MGHAIERINPTRLVHGAASIRAACSGGTITHLIQTMTSAVMQAPARPRLRIVLKSEPSLAYRAGRSD